MRRPVAQANVCGSPQSGAHSPRRPVRPEMASWPELVGKSLSETVARWRDIYQSTSHPRLVPMPHPSWRNNAWLKRNSWFETELLPVLRADIARIVASTRRSPDRDFEAARD